MEYYCEKGGTTYREPKYSIPQYKCTHATDFFIQFVTFLISNMGYDRLVHCHSDILQWKLLPTKRQYLNKASLSTTYTTYFLIMFNLPFLKAIKHQKS